MGAAQLVIGVIGLGASFATFVLMRFPQHRQQQYRGSAFAKSLHAAAQTDDARVEHGRESSSALVSVGAPCRARLEEVGLAGETNAEPSTTIAAAENRLPLVEADPRQQDTMGR